jgi:hypothetical protein
VIGHGTNVVHVVLYDAICVPMESQTSGNAHRYVFIFNLQHTAGYNIYSPFVNRTSVLFKATFLSTGHIMDAYYS